jgi:site-specific DNA recombinase
VARETPNVPGSARSGCAYDLDYRTAARAPCRFGSCCGGRPIRETPKARSVTHEILLPAGIPPQHARPIRSGSRALLVASIARGRRWLAELLADANANAESVAKHERCSVRKVNMTISLAFLAPDLVKAAIAGRLPHGMGVARLADMPAEWSRQHQMLGLPSAVG